MAEAVATLNNFFDNFYLLASGQIEYDTNIKSSTKEISFQTLTTYSSGLTKDFIPVTFDRGINTRAAGVELLQIFPSESTNYVAMTKPTCISWVDINGTIYVNYITGLENNTKYTARFRVT
jgi:hypothetical protein